MNKELSIEEKAKAYDSIFERLKKMYNNNKTNIVARLIYERYFPELKESEDEKIKKRIIALINAHGQGMYKEDMLAWLEKKGEQKSQGKSALEAINEEKVDNANKVEPKFKVGDWISGYYTNYKVLSVNNDGYLVEDVDGNKINILFENEKFHHLFTIADAKDGDVLCCESGWTCIFKALDNHTNTFSSYSFMDKTGWFCETGSEAHTLEKAFIKAYNGNIFPATKEQRELLFSKMKEAGYEWDANHKQLKKIEQKPAWSEEDEAVLDALIRRLEGEDVYISPHLATECLKSLKERVMHQQQKWSEEDKNRFTNLISLVKCSKENDATKIGFIRFINKLKSFNLKNTWKPSDEQIKVLFEILIFALNHKSPHWNDYIFGTLKNLIRQLKKLKKE